MKNLPYKKAPCKDCPFRTDSLKGWLGENRMEEILDQESFVCHKTSNLEDHNKRQCVGHMTICKESNVFVRTAHLMNIPIEIRNTKVIFDNKQDLINHHSSSIDKDE